MTVIMLLFFNMANAQSAKLKCPKKKSFWKSDRPARKLVQLPKVKLPDMPSIKLPKVKLPAINKPHISMPEIKEPHFAIQKSRRTASTKCPH